MAAQAVPYHPFIPFHGDANTYTMVGPFLMPMDYTGWRSEAQSWKDGAYLGTMISAAPTFTVRGPDAERFLSETFVNDFSTLAIGGSRHAIASDDDGRIMIDGVVLRTGPDSYYTTWVAPYIEYALGAGDYDAVGENLTGRAFLYQIGGPRSLEILEQAFDTDLHDIRFGHHRTIQTAVGEVRVYRLGMAGGLSYEVHGGADVSHPVYEAIWEAGRAFGMKKLGNRAYMLNHTEDGFPQAYYHFPYPWHEDPGFSAWLDARPYADVMSPRHPRLLGSLGDELGKRFITPFDAGWENRIHWDHEFRGKEALRRLAAAPPRTVVTLEWNADDIADIYASQFRDGQPYAYIDDRPNDVFFEGTDTDGRPFPFGYLADAVLKDGVEVGVSTGRSISQTYQRMISMGFVDRRHATIGTELTVLWGSAGTRQKAVRVTVQRIPYLQVTRNGDVDVESIPRRHSEAVQSGVQ